MNDNSLRRASLFGALCLLSIAQQLASQCQHDWQPGPEAPGPHGPVESVLVAANGDLIVGGDFLAAGSVGASNIARFDGNQWHALGAGVDGGSYGRVFKVVQLPNGDLVAAGRFQSAGGVPAANIARWDGTGWLPLGAGMDDDVHDLLVLANGDLVAVGRFANAGGTAANHAAVWDGLSWSAMGVGPMAVSNSVTMLPNGNVVTGGDAVGTTPEIEVWDGTSWSPLPGVAGNDLFGVSVVQALPSGEIAVLGGTTGTSPIVVYDGTQLVDLPTPLLDVDDLGLDANGDLLAIGFLPLAPTGVARYDGSGWSTVATSQSISFDRLAVGASGAIYAARSTTLFPTWGQNKIAQAVGGSLVPPPTAPLVLGYAVASLPTGDVIFGGEFSEIEGTVATNIARRTSNGWTSLGQGVDGRVRDIAIAPDGTAIVIGSFTHAGGVPANNIARWNGTTWSTLGQGLSTLGSFVAIDAAGNVLAEHAGRVSFYDGQSWTLVAIVSGTTHDMVALPSGDFLLGGVFITSGQPALQTVLRVSNGAITPVAGFGTDTVHAMLVEETGTVLVAHTDNNTAVIERYDGGIVLPHSSTPGLGDLHHLRSTPDGGLVAYSTALQKIVRWNGSTWTPVPGSPEHRVTDLAVGANGDLIAAGTFGNAGPYGSLGFARAVPTCPAVATPYGSGCVGSAGIVYLQTDDRPWLGTTMQQTATGMISNSIALLAVGTQTNVLPLPLGAPGCSLIVAPVFVTQAFPQNGEASAPLSIANASALIGQTLFTQVVGIELDPSFAIVQTTASNALQLTVGSF